MQFNPDVQESAVSGSRSFPEPGQPAPALGPLETPSGETS